MEGGAFGARKEGTGNGGTDSDATDGTGVPPASTDGSAGEFEDPNNFQIPNATIHPFVPNEDGGGTGEASDGDAGFLSGVSTDTGPRTRRRRRTRAEIERDEGRAQVSDRVDVDVLTWTLLSIHAMVEGATKIPEATLNEEEARKIAECSARVASFYTGSVSPKTQAWTALMLCLGGIYGSRVVAYVLRTRAEREAAMAQARREAETDPTKVNLGHF